MLGAKDLVGYSSLYNSSSYCLFKPLSNAGEECYRPLGSRQSPVLLSYLRYYSYFCQLLLCWEVVEFKAPLEDPLYKFPNLGLAGAEQLHCRAVCACGGAGDPYCVSLRLL
jgi:hypothetical protein